MEDRFSNFTPGISSPATRAIGIMPNDTNALPFFPRAIYVGGAGNLTTRAQDGSEAVWKNVAAGTVLPFRPAMILATGTTATDIVALD